MTGLPVMAEWRGMPDFFHRSVLPLDSKRNFGCSTNASMFRVPVLLMIMGFDRQGPHQPEAAFRVGKDPHDVRPALQLLVRPLQHVRRFQMLVMLRPPVEAERLLDVLLHPIAYLRIVPLPLRHPRREVLAHGFRRS